MSKLQIIRYSYYFLMVCWILQAMLGGLNQYLIIPSICLVLCYVLMKRHERKQIFIELLFQSLLKMILLN